MSAQAQCVHRLVRLVAEVLSSATRAIREYAIEAQDAVWIGLPVDCARSLDQGLSRSGLQARGSRIDFEGQCRRPARTRLTKAQKKSSWDIQPPLVVRPCLPGPAAGDPEFRSSSSLSAPTRAGDRASR